MYIPIFQNTRCKYFCVHTCVKLQYTTIIWPFLHRQLSFKYILMQVLAQPNQCEYLIGNQAAAAGTTYYCRARLEACHASPSSFNFNLMTHRQLYPRYNTMYNQEYKSENEKFILMQLHQIGLILRFILLSVCLWVKL